MGLLSPDDMYGPPNVKLIADTYEHSNLMWDMFLKGLYNDELLRSLLPANGYNRDRELITLTTGARLQKMSSDRPQSLAGHTITLAVVDEAAFVKDDAIEMLLPCLAVRQGSILAFGTAEGAGWHRLWAIKGQDPDFPQHWSTNSPSTDNPYFPPSELETVRLQLPERRYRQLYLAEWQASEGGVFHNINGCILRDAPLHTDPEEGRPYVIGVDLGRYHDYTVIFVADARTARLVHMERWSNIDWMEQLERLEKIYKWYNQGTIVPDATAAGDVMVRLMQERGMDVAPVVMTPQMKERIFQKLAVCLEREDIRFPEYKELIRELNLMDSKTLPSGGIRLAAPIGYHDDCVVALALVNWGIQLGYAKGANPTAIETLW